MKKKLFIVVNVDSFFLSHRLPIAIAAKEKGYNVTILTRNTGEKEKICSYGFNFIDIPFERSGLNPFHEIRCIGLLFQIYRKHQPDIIHHIALKACVLGSIAAKIANIKNVVNAISGLGYLFIEDRNGIKQKAIRTIIRYSLKGEAYRYIFQNLDDVNDFFGSDKKPLLRTHIIKGSGVDLNEFCFTEPVAKEQLHVVLHGRMLYDKGIIEFIEAARKIKRQFSDKVRFLLIGPSDVYNPAGISDDKLRYLMEEPYLEWIGYRKDILSLLQKADIVVLPSYREGLPKSLIEACAVGRPIITTDTPGCRECVIEGQNGYLVPVRDKDLLAEKIEILLQDPEKRKEMGKCSRMFAEKDFSIETVVHDHLDIYDQVVTSKK